jgi:hypothetical protein
MGEPDSSAAAPVTVLTVRDPGVLAVAQSLLEGAAIPFFVKGQNARNLTPLLLWVELQVEPGDAEDARALLAGLAQP